MVPFCFLAAIHWQTCQFSPQDFILKLRRQWNTQCLSVRKHHFRRPKQNEKNSMTTSPPNLCFINKIITPFFVSLTSAAHQFNDGIITNILILITYCYYYYLLTFKPSVFLNRNLKKTDLLKVIFTSYNYNTHLKQKSLKTCCRRSAPASPKVTI